MSDYHIYSDTCGIRRPGDPPPGTLIGPMQLPVSYIKAGEKTKASDSPASRKSGQSLRGRAHHKKLFV